MEAEACTALVVSGRGLARTVLRSVHRSRGCPILVSNLLILAAIAKNGSRIRKARGVHCPHNGHFCVNFFNRARRAVGTSAPQRFGSSVRSCGRVGVQGVHEDEPAGPDGKLLQPNLIFEKLFGDTELLDRINRDAGAKMARAIARLPFPMAARSGSRRYRWTAGGWSAPTT